MIPPVIKPKFPKPNTVRGVVEFVGDCYIDDLNAQLLWANQHSAMAMVNQLLAQREGAEELLKRIITKVFGGA